MTYQEEKEAAEKINRKFNRMCAIRRKMLSYSESRYISDKTKAHIAQKAVDFRTSINFLKPAAKVAKDFLDKDYRQSGVHQFLSSTNGMSGFEILMKAK